MKSVTDAFLAIDPGTHSTGLALFIGDTLERYWHIEPAKGLEVEERIGEIVSRIDRIAGHHESRIRQIACEKPMGIDAYRPAPELQVLIRRLKRWATRKPHRWVWTEYHPSAVVAAVRLRGVKGDTKDIIAAGVRALYPGIQVDVAQDVLDSIAVGHCHLVKTGEKALEGRL